MNCQKNKKGMRSPHSPPPTACAKRCYPPKSSAAADNNCTSVQRGEKRAAEDPPANCGDDDSVDEKGEMEQQEDVSMDCMSFQEYCDKILEVCGWLLVENLKKM